MNILKEAFTKQFQQNNQNYEEIKRKKLDELKKAVMLENNKPFNSIQVKAESSKSPRISQTSSAVGA